MKSPIAFVSESTLQTQETWLSHLQKAMPEEDVRLLDDLKDEEREKCTLAFVANPSPEKLKTLPNLIWVHSLWAGVEKMAAEIGVAPFQIVRMEDPDMANTMAEAVLSWCLYIHRDMPLYAQQQQNHNWEEHFYTSASDRPIGIIGLGNLGKTAAQTLARLGFPVYGWSRSRKTLDNVTCYAGKEEFNDFLSKINILVLLAPLTPETRGLINDNVLTKLPKGASLINFARGPIVVTEALIKALDKGHLSHAVLDVFDVEPLPETSPLWDNPKVTVLPHISAPTNMKTASLIVAKNVRAFRQNGKIPKSVDMKRGY